MKENLMLEPLALAVTVMDKNGKLKESKKEREDREKSSGFTSLYGAAATLRYGHSHFNTHSKRCAGLQALTRNPSSSCSVHYTIPRRAPHQRPQFEQTAVGIPRRGRQQRRDRAHLKFWASASSFFCGVRLQMECEFQRIQLNSFTLAL